MRAEERRGSLAILIAAASYGFLSVFVKLALDAGVDVLALAAWRFVLGAALVWVLLAVRRRPIPPLRSWPALAGLGLLYSVDSLAYVSALQWVPAATAVLVFYVYPVVVVLLAAAFLGERLTAMQLAGFALVSVGVVVVHPPQATPGARRFGRGVAYGALAVLLMAAAIVLVKRVLERNDLFWVSAVRLAAGVVVIRFPRSRGSPDRWRRSTPRRG